MGEQKIEIKADESTKQIIIREGEAQDIALPKGMVINGTLQAPFQFLEKKISGKDVAAMGTDCPLALTEQEKIYNPKRSTLLVDRISGTLTLKLNEKDPYEDLITGNLTLDPSWKEFGINTDKLMNLNEVIKLIKRNKFKFADAAKHSEFLVTLQNFNARVTTTFKNMKDQGGSSIDSVEKIVAENKNAPEFALEVPIYQSYPKKKFRVQTCLDAQGSQIMFYFESVELFELIDSEREKSINDEIAKFEEKFPCSIVNVG